MKSKLQSIAELQQHLQRFPQFSLTLHDQAVLDRLSRAMAAVGNPHDQLRVVHVAGTSGKTSTAYYVGALLHAASARVGVSISPYTYAITERLQIDDEPLSEAQWCEDLPVFLKELGPVSAELGYLELLTVFAFWELQRQHIDYAIIETNAGGRFDATNIARRPDKTCIITDIGYDHTDMLGTTIAQIAGNKAGIIHAENAGIMLKQELGIMRVLDEHCSRVGGHLAVVHEEPRGELSKALQSLPLYQQRNWWLAYQTYKMIAQRDGLPVLSDQQLIATMRTVIPGRMERVRYRGAEIIMDAAHNPQKITGLLSSLQHMSPGARPAMLLMIGGQKDAAEMLRRLKSVRPLLICSEYGQIPGLPHQAYRAAELGKLARKVGHDPKNIIVEPDARKALEKLMAALTTLRVVTGTIYGLNDIRKLL